MKGHAVQNSKTVVSVAQLVSDANAQGGAWIDTRGYDEAVLQLLTSTLGAPTPTWT